MTDTTSDVAPRTLYYIGRRIIKGKMTHGFVEAVGDDDVTFFPKAKAGYFTGAVIGFRYTFEGGRIPTIWSSAKDGQADEEDRLRWQARDRAAYLETQQKGADSSPDLEKHIAALRIARGAVPFNARTSFDAWLLSKVR